MADDSDPVPIQPDLAKVPADAQPAVRTISDRLGSLLGRLEARKRELAGLGDKLEEVKRRLAVAVYKLKHHGEGPPGPPGPPPPPPPPPKKDPDDDDDDPPPPPPDPPNKPPAAGDIVRYAGKCFTADNLGTRFCIETSCFWAPWAEKFDPGKLDAHVQLFSDGGVDYVRWFGQVGPDGGWDDRVIDPKWSDYWDVVERTTRKFLARGVRSRVTLMASGANMGGASTRQAFVDRWAVLINKIPEAYQYIEIANENGNNGPVDSEARALSARLRDKIPVLVAVSSPGGADSGDWTLLANQVSDIATVHWSRDINGLGGKWRPVRQPWDYQFAGDVPKGMCSGEPIGIQSSVAEDDNPERLVMAAAVNMIAGGTGYCLHHGAGIRGGGQADLARGRASNAWEQPTYGACLAGLRALRNWVPLDVCNWTTQNQHWAGHPFVFDYEPRLVRNYAAVRGGEYICAPHGITGGALTFTVKAAVHVKVYRPETGALVFEQDVAAGGSFTVDNTDQQYNDGIGYSVGIRGRLL